MDRVLQWVVELEDGRIRKGVCPFEEGRIRIDMTLPEGVIAKAAARIYLPVPDDARIFMNGYQSWTLSPMRKKKEWQRGILGLGPLAVGHYALDRYADYHFMPYSTRSGILHGYTWCCFRTDDDLLIGSVNERPGYTVFRYGAKNSMLYIFRDCIGMKCGGPFTLLDLFVGKGTETEVYDGWFDAMGIKPRTAKKLAGYTSWYNRYEDITEESIYEDLAGTEGLLREGDLFQIDDGWEPHVGDWLAPDTGRFPHGMKAAADAIHEKGYLAGLWLAPFAAEKDSDIYQEHQDWLLKDPKSGRPWKAGSNWSDFYSLDIDNPEVEDYIRKSLGQAVREWGYDLLKLDFLYAAAPFGNETESRAGRMFRAFSLLRECCGDALILACGVPLAPAFGMADYCRIGCDVTIDWNDIPHKRMANPERPSTRNAITNAITRYPLNGRAFGCDPDVFFLRKENLRLSFAKKNQLLGTCALYGNVFLTSDNMGKYDAEQKRQYRQMRELFEKQ